MLRRFPSWIWRVSLCLSTTTTACGPASAGAGADVGGDSAVAAANPSDGSQATAVGDGTYAESGTRDAETRDGGQTSDSGGSAPSHADKGEGLLPGGAMAFPPPNGQNVCPDPPLRITFSGPPSLGASGKIRAYTATGTLVAQVDMAAATFSDTVGGATIQTTRPVYVDGNDAVVYLKSHSLGYGQAYYIKVDPGAIVGPSAMPFAISDATTWRFTTAGAAPPKLSSLAVSLSGSGDFCTVQGALDALPTGNAIPATITIGEGIFHEIVHFASKNGITLRGLNRETTILEGTNNNVLNPSTSTRSLVGIDACSGLVIDTMTIRNLTPLGGSQAEALRLQNCDRCVVRNATLESLQDTLLWSGRVYADSCIIAGNVDFVWGTGAAYFNHCELKAVGRAGVNVQARNPASSYGYVFVDSKLTADPGISGQLLGRVDDSVYPASEVAYIGCTMGSQIAPAGWTITGGASTSQLRLWEYGSVDPSGAPIDVSHRAAGSMQLSAAQANALRDRTVVLTGWQPP